MKAMLAPATMIFAAALLVGFAFGPAPAHQEEGSNEGSAVQGKSLYDHYCRVCHGREARGDGVIADDLRVQPTDLTQLARKNKGQFPSDRVIRVIDGRETVRGHGSADMPAWGDIFQKRGDSENEVKQRVSDLVEYLRSIQEQAG